MPAYNVENYIAQSIQSVLEQTYSDFELLVINDGSTDNTVHVVKQFSDERIRLIHNEYNLGLSPSRNRAIRHHAKGEWLALLDADDWWAKERLAIMLEIAKTWRCNFMIDDMQVVLDNKGEQTGSPVYVHSSETTLSRRGVHLLSPTWVNPVLFTDWDLGIMKPLMQRQFLHDNNIYYDETMLAGEDDFPFQIRCLLHGAKYVLIPQAYYFYRIRPNSLSSRRIKMFQKISEVTTNLFEEENVQANPDLVIALQRRKMYIDGVVYYNQFKNAVMSGNVKMAFGQLYRTPSVIPFTLRQLRKSWRVKPWFDMKK